MLYTRKGDTGSTKLFDAPQGMRLSKDSRIFEALGTVDELNCSIGYAKALSQVGGNTILVDGTTASFVEILEKIQQILFKIQAELGGSPKNAEEADVLFLESVIQGVEAVIPPITTFIVPGGVPEGAYLDVCRTVARRAERSVVSIRNAGVRNVHDASVQFLNRLSSALYALARLANHEKGFGESSPRY